MALRSLFNWSGREVAGVVLGEPAVVDGVYVWDGSGIPSGVVGADGTIMVDLLGPIVVPELAPPAPPVTLAEKEAGVVSLVIEENATGQVEVISKDDTGRAFEPADVKTELAELVLAPAEEPARGADKGAETVNGLGSRDADASSGV